MFSTIKTTNSSILSIVKCRVQFEFRRGKEGNLWDLWSITTTRAYCRLCYKEHVPYCYMKHVTVILVSCKIVIREGGGGAFPWKKKKRLKSMACRWTTQIFQFCMVIHTSLIYSLVDRDMTKTDFLLTIWIQYQADRRWEWREISITGFLVDPIPNSHY